VTIAAMAAAVISLNVIDRGSHVDQVVTGPSPLASSILSGNVHHVYFRPVLCQIPPADAHTERASPPPSMSAADIDCSQPNASSLASTVANTETVVTPVIVRDLTGSSRYILGPADLDTKAISDALVIPEDPPHSYGVKIVFTGTGAGQFNLVASHRFPFYEQNTANPPVASLEAVEVNGIVIAVPSIQASRYNGTAIFSGPSSAPYSKQQATQIVQAIRRDLTRP
jgi:hypothetical protein